MNKEAGRMNEKKYIDAEKFKNTLKESLILSPDTAEEFTNIGIVFAISRINSMPSADVADVVRCKDCKHLRIDKDFQTGRYCAIRNVNGGGFCKDNDFCSYGERKDGMCIR